MRSAKDMGQPGKTNVLLIRQLATELITKILEIKNKHIIKSDRNNEINLIIVINCFRLLTHHDIDHVQNYFRND